ncbi:solute carrier family 22 member 8 [Eurytemora carolleeae]|uniref:solute carrier family 22 member 8 n=1 Tax=Eurytemora carolleeae TaxID=1294199 RepID=UPI000C7666CD|nr:solute carrier family 22 member 8 [Eurytemora carolleeae]|eukprot:XP_023336870.1 solute carrier family 22 member 8-like [Eurytemora affinis]
MRRKVLVSFVALFCISGLICTFSPSFELWLAARVLWGASTMGLRSIKIVTSLEMIGSSWRAIICVGFIEGGWTAGYLTLPLVSWLIPNGFYLQLIVALSILPGLPLIYCLQESPRWLLATGKTFECQQSLKNILKFNRKDTVVPNLAPKHIEEKRAKANFWDLFKKPMIRRNTIVISLAWFSLGMLYFGLSLHMPEFDANIYLIFFLAGLVEIPADILPFILLNRFGRRWTLVFHYILGGILCMSTAAVPLGVYTYEWPIVVLAMCGKYVSQVCWGIVYLYTTELFPTVVRSVGLSFACSMARLGSMLAPFIASLAYVDPILPIFIFGVVTFVVGVQAIILPETNKKKLPDTLEEGELFYVANNPFKRYCQ